MRPDWVKLALIKHEVEQIKIRQLYPFPPSFLEENKKCSGEQDCGCFVDKVSA